MTGEDQCPQIRQELGVYLLGTIEPARRAVLARHLATCPECRAELAGLAGLPALLGRVPADELRLLLQGDVIAPVPGPPLSALLGRMTRVRRRRRYLAIAGALIVGVAAVSGWQALRPPGPSAAGAAPRWEATDEAVNPVTGAGAAVRYAAEPWGSELEVSRQRRRCRDPLPVLGHRAARAAGGCGRLDRRGGPAGLVASGVGAVPGLHVAQLPGHRGRQGPGHHRGQLRSATHTGVGQIPGFPCCSADCACWRRRRGPALRLRDCR